MWTAPRCIQAEDEYLAELQREIVRERRIEEARAAAWLRAQERKREEIRRKKRQQQSAPPAAEAQIVTTDEEWFAAMFKAVPDAGPEASRTLWREAAEKYRSGELAEVGSVKLFDLI